MRILDDVQFECVLIRTVMRKEGVTGEAVLSIVREDGTPDPDSSIKVQLKDTDIILFTPGNRYHFKEVKASSQEDKPQAS